MDTLITAVLVALFLYAMREMAKRPATASPDGRLILRSGWLYPAIGWLCLIAALMCLAVAVWQYPLKEADVWAVVGLVALFGGLGGIIVNDARNRVLLSPQTIEGYSAWRGRVVINWKDVSEVTYSPMNRWFVLRSRDGATVRVSALYTGIDNFLELLRSSVSPELSGAALDSYAKRS